MLPSLLNRTILTLFFFLTTVGSVQAQGINVCGDLRNAYGPYDYRTRDRSKIEVVDRFHFDADVEFLAKPKTSTGGFGADLDYTLRAIPNHHRALMTLVRLVDREKAVKPHGSRYTVDCWFDRAERFSPDDVMVKTIYGLYLAQSRQFQAARKKLESARAMNSGDANVDYNLGLVYFDLKEYDLALESAHRAYAAGFPLPGLRNKLKRAGRWTDPLPQASPSLESDKIDERTLP